MPLTRKAKEELLDSLKGVFSNAASVVFVNFHGLSVDDSQEMREALSSEGVEYKVVKKTLAKKALEESNLKGDVPALEGELAVAYAANDADITAPARGIKDFGKKFDNQVSILGGIFDGEILGQEKMVEIASIPSIEVLRGQFVNVINSPIQGLAVALGAIAEAKTSE